MTDIVERFLKYVSIDTNSNEACGDCPSTPNQTVLANMLADEMKSLGIQDARVDEHGYVYGLVPATDESLPDIGLIAHMDTSDAVPGGPVRARRVYYQGGDIVLNAEKNIVMPEKDYDSLKADRGHELIVTDGTTLLGADDKAGIAAIMTLAEKLVGDKSIPHGNVRIAFTPDEEIGRGADLFDVQGFKVAFAYTVDGGDLSAIEYENFNAASAVVDVKGFSIHPGSAKGKMLNACTLAMRFDALLPVHEVPENTEGHEGFHHLCDMKGDVSAAQLVYIIRDHDREKFETKKRQFQEIADFLNARMGREIYTVTLKDSYYNMREIIEKDMRIVERAQNAIRAEGMTPVCVPVRGGTDGATLSFKGIKCPNLGAGGRNFHGVYEYLNADQLRLSVSVLERIVSAR